MLNKLLGNDEEAQPSLFIWVSFYSTYWFIIFLKFSGVSRALNIQPSNICILPCLKDSWQVTDIQKVQFTTSHS